MNTPVSTNQRTLQAAHLLQEALALLNADPVQQNQAIMSYAPDRLIRLPEVVLLTGLCRSAVYEQMQRGVFPRSIKAGPRVAAWSERAIQSWISDRLNSFVS